MRRAPQFVLAILTLGILALAGCAQTGGEVAGGGDAASGSVNPGGPTSGGTDAGPPPTTTPPPSAPPIPADVTITVDDGAGTVTEYTLRCAPAGGTHPDPAAACSNLAAASAVFATPDPNQACTGIYGGPQTATVTGTLNGVALSGRFSRINGCEVARWNALSPVFGPAAGLD